MKIVPAILTSDIDSFWDQINKLSPYYDTFQVDIMDKTYGENETISLFEIKQSLKDHQDLLKKINPWLKEADSVSLQQSIRDLDNAYQKFFKEKTNFPKFKSKKRPKQSYRTNANKNRSILIKDNTIRLPKLGWIRFCKS